LSITVAVALSAARRLQPPRWQRYCSAL